MNRSVNSKQVVVSLIAFLNIIGVNLHARVVDNGTIKVVYTNERKRKIRKIS